MVAMGKKRAVLRHQCDRQGGEAGPEFFGLDAAVGQDVVHDEIMQFARDLQAVDQDFIRHDTLLL